MLLPIKLYCAIAIFIHFFNIDIFIVIVFYLFVYCLF